MTWAENERPQTVVHYPMSDFRLLRRVVCDYNGEDDCVVNFNVYGMVAPFGIGWPALVDGGRLTAKAGSDPLPIDRETLPSGWLRLEISKNITYDPMSLPEWGLGVFVYEADRSWLPVQATVVVGQRILVYDLESLTILNDRRWSPVEWPASAAQTELTLESRLTQDMEWYGSTGMRVPDAWQALLEHSPDARSVWSGGACVVRVTGSPGGGRSGSLLGLSDNVDDQFVFIVADAQSGEASKFEARYRTPSTLDAGGWSVSGPENDGSFPAPVCDLIHGRRKANNLQEMGRFASHLMTHINETRTAGLTLMDGWRDDSRGVIEWRVASTIAFDYQPDRVDCSSGCSYVPYAVGFDSETGCLLVAVANRLDVQAWDQSTLPASC